MAATTAAGGALSHHHGVGLNRGRYLPGYLGPGLRRPGRRQGGSRPGRDPQPGQAGPAVALRGRRLAVGAAGVRRHWPGRWSRARPPSSTRGPVSPPKGAAGRSAADPGGAAHRPSLSGRDSAHSTWRHRTESEAGPAAPPDRPALSGRNSAHPNGRRRTEIEPARRRRPPSVTHWTNRRGRGRHRTQAGLPAGDAGGPSLHRRPPTAGPHRRPAAHRPAQ